MFGLKTIAFAALALVAVQGDVLKRELKTGETTDYDIKCTRSTESEDGQFPGHSFTTSWKAGYKVTSVNPEKGADLTVTITDFKFESDANVHMPGGDPPKTRTIQATINDKNVIKPKSDKPADNTTAGWLMTDWIELPNKEVKIGDTWDVTIPASSVLGQKQTVQAKLTGEQEFEGLKAWVVTIQKDKIEIKQTVKVSFGDDKDQKDATISGTGNLTITALIEKGTGRPLSITQKAKVTQKMEMEGMDQPTMVVDYSATMKMRKS